MSRSILPLCGGMMLAGGVAALIILAHPVGMMIFAALAVAFAVGVISGLVVADAINSENKYHEYHDITRESAHCLGEDTDYNTGLRENFFNQKLTPESLTLADEVKEEYLRLS